MIVVSNFLLDKTVGHLTFPFDIVMRVNVAWLTDYGSALKLIETLNKKYDIYLDYPTGRTKPPKPVVTLKEAFDLANKFERIKYFAVSNVEESEDVFLVKSQLRTNIEVVPKIETFLGVENLEVIIDETGIKYVMLDKDDLYLDCSKDEQDYSLLVESVRTVCKRKNVKLLELTGVVFT